MQYMLRRRSGRIPALSLARAALAAGLVLALGSSVLAANGIMLQIKDAPLKEVVMLLTQQTGTNIVIADESKLDKKVTCSLNDVPLERALDYVVKSAGVSYQKMEDGTYIIGGEPEFAVLSPDDIKSELPPVEQPAPVVVVPRKEPKVAVIKLVHSKPSELLRIMGWNRMNPMPNSEVQYPDSGHGLTRTSPTGKLYQFNQNGQVYDYGKGVPMENGQPVPPTIDPTGRSSGANRTADPSTGAGQAPYAGPVTRPPGYTVTRPTQPGAPTAPSPTTTATSGNFLWPEGLVGDPVPFDLDNSIIIKGDDDAIAQFKEMVRMLDVPPKQVEIRAEFIEVKTNDVKRFGIDWSLRQLNESFETQFGPAGNVLFAFASGNLTVAGAAQLTRDIGTIVNAPIISTLNNQWAEIAITNDIPFWTTTTIITEGNAISSPFVEFIHVETGLGVLPRVNGDGTITMTLRPQVSDTGNFVPGPEGMGAFETRRQALFTQRRVANGETIVVGGFIRKNDSNSYQKIPILGDLPIIGSLFRTTAKTTEDRELLIFITPRIIPETVGGTVGSIPIP